MEYLLKLAQSGRIADFLSRAERELEANPEAPGLVLLVLRVLVENGLGGPARELLMMRKDLPSGNPEIEAFAKQLEQLPNGRVPWQSLRSRFDANVAAFRDRFPEVAERVVAIADSFTHYQLHQGRDEDFLFSMREPGKYRHWCDHFSSIQDESSLNVPDKGKLGAFLMGGVRYGNLLQTIHERTKDVVLWMSHPIFIVESDEYKFTAWLHCSDVTEILADERVYLYTGVRAVEEFKQELDDEIQLPCPLHNINLARDPALMESAVSASQQAIKDREAVLNDVYGRLRERYKDRDATYWARRWKKPERVLGITSRFTTVLQYSMRDSLAALEKMGWEFRLIKEQKDHYRFTVLEVLQVIDEYDPDLLLMLDHFRHETGVIPNELPVLSWVQDMLPNLTDMKAWEKLTDLDYVTGHVSKLAKHAEFPDDRTRHHMTPASEFIFHPGPVSDEKVEELSCDLMYAGNLTQTPGEYWDEQWVEVDPRLRPVLEEMRQWVDETYDGGQISCGFDCPKVPYCSETNCRKLHRQQLRDLLEKHGLALPDSGFEMISEIVKCYIDRTFRLETLTWACKWAQEHNRTFRLYGDGWDRFDFCKPYVAGFTQHGEPLRQAHRCATLTLSTPSWGTFHQRVFEAVLSGSLVVHRLLPQFFLCRPFDEMVEVGKQNPDDFMPYYSSLWGTCYFETGFNGYDGFVDTCERLLNNQDHYERIRQQFDEHIRQRHTYNLVLKSCVDMIRDHLEYVSHGFETEIVCNMDAKS